MYPPILPPVDRRRGRLPGRRLTLPLAGALVVLLAAPASADALLDHYRGERDRLTHRVQETKKDVREAERVLRDARKAARSQMFRLTHRPRQREHPKRFRVLLRTVEARHARRIDRVRDRFRSERRELAKLRRRRDSVLSTIDLLTPLKTCPVRGAVRISNDFGAARYVDGKFDHWHRGNDVGAPYGTPIVAPFDGVAAAVWSTLGGWGVKVHGERGYVYNGHLASYGTLGQVRRGTVIGYVGVSGNALGPHDHVEWHPGGGPAVDPHAYLLRACFG